MRLLNISSFTQSPIFVTPAGLQLSSKDKRLRERQQQEEEKMTFSSLHSISCPIMPSYSFENRAGVRIPRRFNFSPVAQERNGKTDMASKEIGMGKTLIFQVLIFLLPEKSFSFFNTQFLQFPSFSTGYSQREIIGNCLHRSIRCLMKKDETLEYRIERVPFLEEQVRKIREGGALIGLDIERLLLSEDNRFDFVNEVAAEAKSYVESNRDEYGGAKKAIYHVLTNRLNDSGIYRPEAYVEPDPFKPGSSKLRQEL
ncbi:hypothetical protein ACLOJK_009837 [Asimina triloba]